MHELPLAGHPVVGTWNLLARLGVVPNDGNGTAEIKQELNLGVLPVEIAFRDGEPAEVTMTQGKWESHAQITDQTAISKLATGLGLEISDLDIRENRPIEVVSTGIRSIDIPVCTMEALSRIRVNTSVLSDAYVPLGAVGCYAFTFETKEDSSLVHARFFAPSDGILEDPATGSAAGALSGYLVSHGLSKGAAFTIEQGDIMGRPSRIYAQVIGGPGNIEHVKIGGSSVVVAKGEMYLP
jgi:trans-2,3-dihydro-3-hydroxyanthranilate isomerase